MDNENYSSGHQYQMLELSFYRPKANGDAPDKEEWLDFSPMMEELDLFEDLVCSQVTGQMLVTDGFNMPDRLPILGGERLKIRFKTPTIDQEVSQTMVIYKVGERIRNKSSEKTQRYWLYLCSEDAWNDAQMDLSFHHQGTYDSLIKTSLEKLKTKKSSDLESTVGVVSYISPFWSPLKICSYAAGRANTAEGDPMFFWETVEKYNFKSLKTLFTQSPHKKIFIEPRNTVSVLENPEKMFNVVLDWNYAEGDDKLTQNRNGDFGTDTYIWDTKNWNVTRQDVSKESIDIIRIDKYPITDVKSPERSKTTSVMTRADGSHLNEVRKKAILDKLDNRRIVVSIPGDSSIRAGYLIELDVPSLTGNVDYVTERIASGKFLCSSVRHILLRDRYRMNLELLKNATEKEVIG